MLSRRRFLATASIPLLAGSGLNIPVGWANPSAPAVSVGLPLGDEDLFAYIRRHRGAFDSSLYRQILGAANEFKEGDAIVGVAAENDLSRTYARQLLAQTKIADLTAYPPWTDRLSEWSDHFVRDDRLGEWKDKSLGQLKQFLLASSGDQIQQLMPGLNSDIIACLVRLMTNQELTAIGQKVFNPLGGSHIGAKGYLGARVQPNSPTDNVDDIRFQVFDAFAYAVGDVLLGTNPVSSDPRSVAAVELALQDILQTFQIDHIIPHCVLAHIDVQAEVERVQPGSTEFWFQSIAGNDNANTTFDITVEKMARYARERKGRFGIYLESGQGADFTNGHGHGTDMVFHESRKYGFARGLAHEIATSKNIPVNQVWLHLNDVAGFIGPEVFRTREQLVRCCLEDIVMGKLHGLTLGLDVCSTLHMDISLDDLDWCLEQIAPANPAYLMALPTKIDPMLGYLTTGYQDHVRLRKKFDYRVDDRMWSFFQRLGVVDEQGQPTNHFGDPHWVYLQYCRYRNDSRTDGEILEESTKKLGEIRSRGVFIAEGYGEQPHDLAPRIRQEIQTVYQDAKQSIWKEWDPAFINRIPGAISVRTQSANRTDYILHPSTGEKLSDESLQVVEKFKVDDQGRSDTVIVISEGLNALALMDEGNLLPLLAQLRPQLTDGGRNVSSNLIVVSSGRVRAGYRIGEVVFKGTTGPRTIIHLIGERPGTGHHTLSAYVTTADGAAWSKPNEVDHNITKVISGIGVTALTPDKGAKDIAALLV